MWYSRPAPLFCLNQKVVVTDPRMERPPTAMLRLRHEALRAANLHYAQTILGADLVFHAIEMVLHRLLREAETIGDFFVGEAVGNQGNQLLLAARQSQLLAYAGGREGRSFSF